MTMDDLCGNSFYRNQMTVTKYIAGRMILTKLRKLVAQKKEKGKAPQVNISIDMLNKDSDSSGDLNADLHVPSEQK